MYYKAKTDGVECNYQDVTHNLIKTCISVGENDARKISQKVSDDKASRFSAPGEENWLIK